MRTLQERMDWLLGQREILAPWVGDFSREKLEAYVEEELGSVGVLDGWEVRGDTCCRAFVRTPLLHVLSGNAPHAAFQSLFRGVLLGARNWVKLPRGGVVEFEEWVAGWSGEISDWVEVCEELSDVWLEGCGGAVVFGEEETLGWFREKLGGRVMIGHGPQVGVAWVRSADQGMLGRLCGDILAFEQKGCLSVQTVCVEGGWEKCWEVAEGLAGAMRVARAGEWRREKLPSFSESGAIFQVREMTRFGLANGLWGGGLWESEGSSEWTVMLRDGVDLVLGEGNGVVRVQPVPEKVGDWGELGGRVGVLVVEDLGGCEEEFFTSIPVRRFAEVGRGQMPPFFWHHEGRRVLGELVEWRDRV